jgi:EAL domain-containing protein (putative c-di-GMP-specific phosphodiesterase class I)
LVAGHAWDLEGRALTLTASVGIGLFLPPADNAITMLSRAKKACSKARAAGGGRCETYVPSLPRQDSPTSNDRVADLIREALNNDRLSLAYQPIVSLRQCRGERYDALLRLRTSDGELIPPVDFLPVAREFGLMPAIDRWVIARALDQTHARRDGHETLQLFIRLSLDTVALPGMVDWLRDEIARRDLIRQRPALVFDLDDVAANLGQAHACFAGLRRLGIDICLNRMHDSREARRVMADLAPAAVRIAPDALKALPGPNLDALVEAVHACGAKAIAPGIEHPQDIACVWNCGVEFIQGNFVHPAGAALDFDFMGAGLV